MFLYHRPTQPESPGGDLLSTAGMCRVLMQKVAKEYMTTMRSPAVQARLKAGQTAIRASPTSLTQPEVIQHCFAARDGRLLGTLANKMAAAGLPAYAAMLTLF